MKADFKLDRFGKYLAYDLRCLKRKVGPALLLPVIVPVIIELVGRYFNSIGNDCAFFSSAASGPDLSTRLVFFAMVCGIFFLIFPARAYGELTDRQKGGDWLMLPVSRLEKFFSMELICLVMVPVVFLSVYYLVDWLVCLMDGSCGASIIKYYMFGNDEESVLQTADSEILGFSPARSLRSTMCTVSIFLAGALTFKKPRWKIIGTILLIVSVSWIWFAVLMGLNNANHAFAGDRETNLLVFRLLWAIIIIGGGLTWNWFKIKNMEH